MNDTDTGSIMGVDHNNVGTFDAKAVIPTGTFIEHPSNFNLIFPVGTAEGSRLAIQMGANSGQSMELKLCSVKAADLKIESINVTIDAQDAIQRFNDAVETVSKNRAYLGAVQKRLEHALNINENTAENLTNAESRIRDMNIAKGMAEYAKANILTQAAQAMLAQANQQPQQVLQLLR